MRKELRGNLRKITSLILTAAIVMSTNLPVIADDSVIELGKSTENEIIVGCQGEESSQASEVQELVGESKALVKADGVADIAVDDKAVAELGEAEDENILGDGEATVTVQFTDPRFIEFLAVYYGERYPDFELMAAQGDGYGYVNKSLVDSITSLSIVYDEELKDLFSQAEFDAMVLNELTKFENLKNLTIVGNDHIGKPGEEDGTMFPSSLEKLTIDDCQFSVNPDISNCTGLKDLVFTNNTFATSSVSTIKGLDAVNSHVLKLESARFDYSGISEIILPGETGSGVTVISPGLKFSATYCESIEKVDLGGYKIINSVRNILDGEGTGEIIGTEYVSVDLRHCINLQKLFVRNGYADLPNQILDVNECYKLSETELHYYFTDAVNRLNIEAGGITSVDSTTGLELNRTSAGGKYTLSAFEGSYLYAKWNDCLSELRDDENSHFEDSSPKFVLFEQEVEKFRKMSLYREENSTYRRDYSSNPVILRIGDVINDNSARFVTENGVFLNDVGYTMEEGEVEGVKPGIISVEDNSNLNKTIALKAGITSVKATITGGDSESRAQIIHVYVPMKSLEINAGNAVIDEPGQYDVETTMTATDEYSSLLTDKNNSLGGIVWDSIEYKDGNEWKPAGKTHFTDAGITVTTDPSNNKGHQIDSTVEVGKLKNYSKIVVKENAVSGEYRIKGYIADNYKNGTANRTSIDGNISDEFIYSTGGDKGDGYYYFTVMNAWLSSDAKDENDAYITTLGYGGAGNTASNITINMPDLGDKYTVLGASVNYSGDTCPVEVTKITGTENFKVSYKKDATSEDVAKFITSIEGSKYVITVDVNLKNNSDGTTKTFSKKIPVAGKFTIKYDLGEGATMEAGNPTSYSLPINSEEFTGIEFPIIPKMEGSEFLGWYRGDTLVTKLEKEALTGDITLTAKWKSLSHTHEEVIDSYLAPTCSTPGKTEGSHCSICGEVIVAQKEIAALGHRLDSGKITKAATADATGEMTYTCQRAGCGYKEVVTIPSIKEAQDVVGEDSKIINNPDKPITDTTVNIIGVKEAVTYTGKPVTFDLRVYVGKTLLKEGTDYTVKYINNTNVPASDAADAMKPQVVITGKGAYRDANTYKFEPVYFAINPVNIEELESAGDAVVTDTAVLASKGSSPKYVKPFPQITVNGTKLTKKDYSVSYGEGHENGIDTNVAGKYTITLTGKGNYAGKLTSIYEVVENTAENPVVLISKATVSGIKKSIPYNAGEALTQSGYIVKCKVGKSNVELTEGTDYTVKYVDNREVGLASMIFTAKAGNDKGLVGQKVVTYKITGLAINKCQISYAKKVEYTGATIKPGLDDKYELTIRDSRNGVDLKYGQDYEVEYFKNVQTGTATMLIIGNDLYTGSVRKTFKITAADLKKGFEDDAKIVKAEVVAGSVKLESEGKLKGKYTATVSVTFNGKELKKGKDYDVSYKNNKTPALVSEAGSKAPTVIIKGKGNYAKSIPLTFDIVEQ